ncbi:hypothetical protein MMC10_008538 [Thelotrema lepadinum]|nr:hypothetical protein [Thelotrema lepadinum]
MSRKRGIMSLSTILGPPESVRKKQRLQSSSGRQAMSITAIIAPPAPVDKSQRSQSSSGRQTMSITSVIEPSEPTSKNQRWQSNSGRRAIPITAIVEPSEPVSNNQRSQSNSKRQAIPITAIIDPSEPVDKSQRVQSSSERPASIQPRQDKLPTSTEVFRIAERNLTPLESIQRDTCLEHGRTEPVDDDGPVDDNTPVDVADAPVDNDTPLHDDGPVLDDAPLHDDGLVLDGAPLHDDGPAIDDAPLHDDEPMLDGAPLDDDGPATDDVPLHDDGPVIDDAPLNNIAPAISGSSMSFDAPRSTFTCSQYLANFEMQSDDHESLIDNNTEPLIDNNIEPLTDSNTEDDQHLEAEDSSDGEVDAEDFFENELYAENLFDIANRAYRDGSVDSIVHTFPALLKEDGASTFALDDGRDFMDFTEQANALDLFTENHQRVSRDYFAQLEDVQPHQDALKRFFAMQDTERATRTQPNRAERTQPIRAGRTQPTRTQPTTTEPTRFECTKDPLLFQHFKEFARQELAISAETEPHLLQCPAGSLNASLLLIGPNPGRKQSRVNKVMAPYGACGEPVLIGVRSMKEKGLWGSDVLISGMSFRCEHASPTDVYPEAYELDQRTLHREFSRSVWDLSSARVVLVFGSTTRDQLSTWFRESYTPIYLFPGYPPQAFLLWHGEDIARIVLYIRHPGQMFSCDSLSAASVQDFVINLAVALSGAECRIKPNEYTAILKQRKMKNCENPASVTTVQTIQRTMVSDYMKSISLPGSLSSGSVLHQYPQEIRDLIRDNPGPRPGEDPLLHHPLHHLLGLLCPAPTARHYRTIPKCKFCVEPANQHPIAAKQEPKGIFVGDVTQSIDALLMVVKILRKAEKMDGVESVLG